VCVCVYVCVCVCVCVIYKPQKEASLVGSALSATKVKVHLV